jgi:hypothetical protein
MRTRLGFILVLYLNTYALKSDKAKGAKTSKERLTILGCVSINGEKQKLKVIGKSQNSRCFKGVKTLPVDYKGEKALG